MQEREIKRLFFGFETCAPWPNTFPEGRLLAEKDRHITLAFLGNVDAFLVKKLLPTLPLPSFEVGMAGLFDKPWLLPKKAPRLIAWHARWLEESAPLVAFQKNLVTYLGDQGLHLEEKHPFTPHVTLCRKPKNPKAWQEAFSPLPFYTQHLHLFESLGYSKYQSLWHHPLLPPFEPIEHTADLAFKVYGTSLTHLFLHAQLALAFTYPKLLLFWQKPPKTNTLHDVVDTLNHTLSIVDENIGAPFKAVSHHGALHQQQQLYTWEMIIDV